MKNFKKTITICLTLFVALSLTGLGCKGLSEEEQIAVKSVNLNYWTIYNDVGVLREFAEEYKKIRPYVNINIKQVRYDEFDNLFLNALADDVAPDMISVHTRNLKKYTNRLSKMPASVNVSSIYVEGKYKKETKVETYQQAMPSVNYLNKNYIGTVSEDAVVGGSIYGLPLAVDTLAIFYNKDLLDKAGIPEPPTNWEEFMEAVKKTSRFNSEGTIVQSGVSLGTANNIDNAFDIVSLFMMQSGVQMSKGNYVGFNSGLSAKTPDSHPTTKALRFYTDFARPEKEVYTWDEKMGNALDEFVRGKTTFYFGFAYDLPRVKSRAPQMNFEIIPVPQLNEDVPMNVANYWLECVTKKSTNQDEAWDFIRFMSSAENVKKYTEETRRPSPLRAHVNTQKEDLLLAPFTANVLNLENWYRGRDYDTAQKAIEDLIHDYLEPAEVGESVDVRNAGLINKAASIIQQTM